MQAFVIFFASTPSHICVTSSKEKIANLYKKFQASLEKQAQKRDAASQSSLDDNTKEQPPKKIKVKHFEEQAKLFKEITEKSEVQIKQLRMKNEANDAKAKPAAPSLNQAFIAKVGPVIRAPVAQSKAKQQPTAPAPLNQAFIAKDGPAAPAPVAKSNSRRQQPATPAPLNQAFIAKVGPAVQASVAQSNSQQQQPQPHDLIPNMFLQNFQQALQANNASASWIQQHADNLNLLQKAKNCQLQANAHQQPPEEEAREDVTLQSSVDSEEKDIAAEMLCKIRKGN